ARCLRKERIVSAHHSDAAEGCLEYGIGIAGTRPIALLGGQMGLAMTADLVTVRTDEDGGGDEVARFADDGGYCNDAAVALCNLRSGTNVGFGAISSPLGIGWARQPRPDQRVFRQSENLHAELGGVIEHGEDVVGANTVGHVHLHGRDLAGCTRRYDRLVRGPGDREIVIVLDQDAVSRWAPVGEFVVGSVNRLVA